MKPELLNYIDDLVRDHLELMELRKTDKSWKNESEDLKVSTEEEIKLCNEFLDESLKLQNVGDI
tara:strand:+ start:438 stop:629 length:192 start_codon:yes stop_codon:yes gene_type:complete